MAVTPIQARCRRCREDFSLFEILDQRSGICPRCGVSLSPDWTANLLEDAALVDVAQRHFVGALRSLRNHPGNVLLRPHTVLRNLFEEVGWERDLADHPDVLHEELREIRSMLISWERIDPVAAAARPYRGWFARTIDWLTGRQAEPIVQNPVPLRSRDDNQLAPRRNDDRDARNQPVDEVSTAS